MVRAEQADADDAGRRLHRHDGVRDDAGKRRARGVGDIDETM
jgi:hypothetical protein